MPAADGAGLVLDLLRSTLAVCRLEPDAAVPGWSDGGPFVALTRTDDELSIVCESHRVPEDVRAERGWRAFRVRGSLDFELTGILAGLVGPLAEARVPVFAISTFETDYLLVREQDLNHAVEALEGAGHRIEEQGV